MAEKGTLQWAAYQARSTHKAVRIGNLTAYWDTHLHALCWCKTDCLVLVSSENLTGWSRAQPGPPAEGSHDWALTKLLGGWDVEAACLDRDNEWKRVRLEGTTLIRWACPGGGKQGHMHADGQNHEYRLKPTAEPAPTIDPWDILQDMALRLYAVAHEMTDAFNKEKQNA